MTSRAAVGVTLTLLFTGVVLLSTREEVEDSSLPGQEAANIERLDNSSSVQQISKSNDRSDDSFATRARRGGSEKRDERQLLSDDPARLHDLAPLETGRSPESQQRAQARAARAQTLNVRLERRLEELRARRLSVSGAEEEELDRAIAQLERNLELRGGLESAGQPPQRIE